MTWTVIAVTGYAHEEHDQGSRIWSQSFPSLSAAKAIASWLRQKGEDVRVEVFSDQGEPS